MTEAISDIQTAFWLIMGSAALALVFGLVWMVVMKCFAACVTWTVILLAFLLTIFLTWWVYDESLVR